MRWQRGCGIQEQSRRDHGSRMFPFLSKGNCLCKQSFFFFSLSKLWDWLVYFPWVGGWWFFFLLSHHQELGSNYRHIWLSQEETMKHAVNGGQGSVKHGQCVGRNPLDSSTDQSSLPMPRNTGSWTSFYLSSC